MARPSKYTAETLTRVEEALSQGATYQLASAYAGITYETFNTWRGKFSEFSDAVKKAEARAAVGWLAQIERAATEGSWQAAAWKLERRYPDDWGRKERLDISIKRMAEQLAAEHGLDAEALIREAERIVGGKR